MNEPKISVIVTVYNKELFVSKCIESLLNQTDNDFQVIIINDSSNDGSLDIINKLIKDNRSYRLLSQEHNGVSSARNYGLSLVQTPYVLFLDGDDWLIQNAIEILNRLITETPTDILIYGFSHIMSDGTTYDHITSPRIYKNRDEVLNHFLSLWKSGLMYTSCNKLFSMELIKNHNLHFEMIDFGEDFSFCRECLKYSQSVRVIDDSLYRYTFHNDNSLSTIYRSNLFETRCNEHMVMCDYFMEMGISGQSAEEFLARRHAERIIGCIENEHSPHNPSRFLNKYRRIKEIVNYDLTIDCIRKS